MVEDWCRFGLGREDLVISLKDWRQRLGKLHQERYKQARSTVTDPGAGLEHPAQLDRHSPRQVVEANCGRVQEALRVLEEYGRSVDPPLASEAAAIRYGLYDLEVTCLRPRGNTAATGSGRRLPDHHAMPRSIGWRQPCAVAWPWFSTAANPERWERLGKPGPWQLCHPRSLLIINDR